MGIPVYIVPRIMTTALQAKQFLMSWKKPVIFNVIKGSVEGKLKLKFTVDKENRRKDNRNAEQKEDHWKDVL